MKLYVVETEFYGVGKSIDGVFDNKELAKKAKKMEDDEQKRNNNCNYECTISEFNLNESQNWDLEYNG